MWLLSCLKPHHSPTMTQYFRYSTRFLSVCSSKVLRKTRSTIHELRQLPNWETQNRVSVKHLLSLAVVHFTNRLRKSIKLYNILGVKTRLKHFLAWRPNDIDVSFSQTTHIENSLDFWQWSKLKNKCNLLVQILYAWFGGMNFRTF